MNKFTKRLLALGLALSIVAGAGGVSVLANTAQGFINGYKIYCYSDITPNTAHSKTMVCANGGMARITSNYIYLNKNTLQKTKVTKQNRDIQSTEVYFTAPQNCSSVKVYSSHKVEFSSVWSGTTSAVI